MERGTRTDIPESACFVPGEGGALTCDGISLTEIAARHGTPTFVYSWAAMERAYRAIDAALAGTRHLVCYAVKANGHPGILRRLAAIGCGADVVSGGELHWALASGMPADRIVMSGVGKTDDELGAALDAGIRSIHLESAAELDVLEREAARRGVRARLGLRINPNVDARTHPYIATGLHDTKFGLEADVARALAPRILASPHLELECIACHIGSQLPSAAPVEEAVRLTAELVRELRALGAPIGALDAGGGWPIAYGDEDAPADAYEAFGAAIRRGLADLGDDVEVVVEPGRAIVGDVGALLTRVLHVKEQAGKRFVIVDAAMTELIRPSLYGAYHAITPVVPAPIAVLADVVGPVCESGDFFALARPFARVARGDLVIVRGAGAYAASMSSRYNARPAAAEVIVEAGDVNVLRARGRVEDLY